MAFFFNFVAICTIVYFLVRLILWLVLDSDIELFVLSKLGKPISSLKGKVVWITGASSGIGRDLAIALAKNGVRLCLSARNISELLKVKQDCIAQSNGSLGPNDVYVLQMDMLDINHHNDYFNMVIDQFKTLDILVNNAGRSQRADWNNISVKVDRELFELDVFSVVHLSRIALNFFIRNSMKGHLAVTSSTAGLIGAPNSASYTGAKHALHKYNQSVRPEDKRMTSERCGYLYAIALANKTHLSWVGTFPINLILYIGCYYPNVKKLLLKIVGMRRLRQVRDSR
ncbi:dehydrogenase/reductase SDR family member 7-like isoform X2 [Ochlerotatus camptorhynchus]|uniref:dehydrogenase/reductase SDR family member 7-like isoform X2 n=1 Tax=Ochlerotatus camptorhynchus TaxID=644619 RepID=UPI0031D11692